MGSRYWYVHCQRTCLLCTLPRYIETWHPALVAENLSVTTPRPLAIHQRPDNLTYIIQPRTPRLFPRCKTVFPIPS